MSKRLATWSAALTALLTTVTFALAFGFFALCLGATRGERVVRWLFLAAPTLAIVAWVGMSLYFGFDLEYLFEVTVISIDWVTLMVSGTLLTFAFRRSSHTAASAPIQQV